MADGKRPGGLTALAVLNFVFGGIEALGALISLLGIAAVAKMQQYAVEHGGKYEGPPIAFLYMKVGTWAICAALMIASGVGYIKQTKFAGRTLGTAYGLLSLGTTLVFVIMGYEGFDLSTIIFTVYPVLSLILINTTFKDDLVN